MRLNGDQIESRSTTFQIFLLRTKLFSLSQRGSSPKKDNSVIIYSKPRWIAFFSWKQTHILNVLEEIIHTGLKQLEDE